jgi:hypothetical protein
MSRKIYRIPVVGYVLHLVAAFFRLPRNDARIKELRVRLAELSAAVDRASAQSEAARSESMGPLKQHLPALLNALETVPALAHEIARARREVGRLSQRLEVTRMELLHEMNHGPRGAGIPDGPHPSTADVARPDSSTSN